jgi:hypothetical protein
VSRITLSARNHTLVVDLNDSPTAAQLADSLPFESRINTWGDEIYFETPVKTKLETGARAEVDVGDVAYWPPGKALCVFFGPTPASTGERPRAAGPVTIVGRVRGNPSEAGRFQDGETVHVRLEARGERDARGSHG